MNTNSPSNYVNMSAYVALSCLIAFVIVITICLVKQFIWDPLLSKHFQMLRPVLSESMRKFSIPSYFRPQSTVTSSNLSLNKSLSDTYVKTTDPPLLTTRNCTTQPQNLSSNENSITTNLPHHSYGPSSYNSFAYTNYGSEDVSNEKMSLYPVLHFSCEYNPSTFSIRLNVQNLRNMNSLLTSFYPLLTKSACIFVRFRLSSMITGESYETSLHHFQDFIRFGETFIILSNIRSGDLLDYQLKFILMLSNGQNIYELGEIEYSMADDQLTQTLYIERILPIRLEKQIQSAKNDDND